MRPYRYLREGLFLPACALYALNRWVLKPHVHSPFLHDHFNDLLLIPCALPPLLLLQRWLGLRPRGQWPTTAEIAFHLAIWSVLFEVIGPRFMPHTTADSWDVVAYWAGGLLAWAWWSWRARKAGSSSRRTTVLRNSGKTTEASPR